MIKEWKTKGKQRSRNGNQKIDNDRGIENKRKTMIKERTSKGQQ